MKSFTVIFSLMISTMGANAIDFDALSKKKAVKKRISMGFDDANRVNEKKVKDIQKGQAHTISKLLSAAGSGSAMATSGSNTYICSYYCKISGLFSYPTQTFHTIIHANTQYEAVQKLHDISKKHCGGMYKNTTFGKSRMWPNDEKCEHK